MTRFSTKTIQNKDGENDEKNRSTANGTVRRVRLRRKLYKAMSEEEDMVLSMRLLKP